MLLSAKNSLASSYLTVSALHSCTTRQNLFISSLLQQQQQDADGCTSRKVNQSQQGHLPLLRVVSNGFANQHPWALAEHTPNAGVIRSGSRPLLGRLVILIVGVSELYLCEPSLLQCRLFKDGDRRAGSCSKEDVAHLEMITF